MRPVALTQSTRLPLRLTSIEGEPIIHLPTGQPSFVPVMQNGRLLEQYRAARFEPAVTPHCLLVEGLGKLVLINTGPWYGTNFQLAKSLRRAGVDPSQIGAVILTGLSQEEAGGVFGFLESSAQIIVSQKAYERALEEGSDIGRALCEQRERVVLVEEEGSVPLLGSQIQFLWSDASVEYGRMIPVILTTLGMVVFGGDLTDQAQWIFLDNPPTAQAFHQQVATKGAWVHLYADPVVRGCQVVLREGGFESTHEMVDRSVPWDYVGPAIVRTQPMEVVSWASWQCLGKRKVQQDVRDIRRCHASPIQWLGMIGDGHGPSDNLLVADIGQVAIDIFANELQVAARAHPMAPVDLWAHHAVQRAEQYYLNRLLEEMEKCAPDERMSFTMDTGSTLEAVFQVGNRFFAVHLGDSRTYVISAKTGQIRLRTIAHHRFTDINLQGYFLTHSLGHLNYSTVCDHQANLSSSRKLAELSARPDVIELTGLQEGDLVLICSDGVSDVLKDDQIKNLLWNKTPSEGIELLKQVLEKTAEDNATAILFQVGINQPWSTHQRRREPDR